MTKLLIAIIGLSLAFGTTAYAEETTEAPAKKEVKAKKKGKKKELPTEVLALKIELAKKVKAGDMTKKEMKTAIRAKMKELKGAKPEKGKKKKDA